MADHLERVARRAWFDALGWHRVGALLPSVAQLQELTLERSTGTFIMGVLLGLVFASVAILAVWVL